MKPLIKILFAWLLSLSAILTVEAQTRMLVSCRQSNGTGRGHDIEAYLAESVDELPEFPGGEAALIRYINSVRRYPSEAYSRGIQGRVLCSFIVGSDGTISNVEIVRGVDEDLNREALRVIRHMPRWKAGRLDGASVPVFCILPVPFRL